VDECATVTPLKNVIRDKIAAKTALEPKLITIAVAEKKVLEDLESRARMNEYPAPAGHALCQIL